FAAGAAAALLRGKGGDVYELAGDEAWTMQDFAAEVSRQSGRQVEYVDQSEADYARTLEGAGLPPPVASMLASTSALSGPGALYDAGKSLSRLSGKPTTPIGDTIAAALKETSEEVASPALKLGGSGFEGGTRPHEQRAAAHQQSIPEAGRLAGQQDGVVRSHP